jgi:hypothetical protein
MNEAQDHTTLMLLLKNGSEAREHAMRYEPGGGVVAEAASGFKGWEAGPSAGLRVGSALP